MKKICVLTSIRSEYGLLKNLIAKIEEDKDLELILIATGAHLSPLHGNSISEIEEDGFPIAERLSYLSSGIEKADRAKEVGMFNIQLANSFQRLRPDMLILLGDRYESLGAAMVAMMFNIPICHIAGGEITEGLIDEQVRHAITKMAHIHFAEAKVYADNIVKMGEERWRVFNVGALGIENINTVQVLKRSELEKELNIEINKNTLLITYHPVTLELDQLQWQVGQLIGALEELSCNMIITYPNVDQGGEYIIRKILEFACNKENVCVVENLGIKRYLNVMRYCGVVVGNSSSALIEAPYLKIPVVNVGNRQKGRLMAENIISCSNEKESIVTSINLALSSEFKRKCESIRSLYGNGETSTKIVQVLKEMELNERLLKKKLIWSE